MNQAIIAAAIFSAILHAGWNIIAKTRSAPRDILFGISIATATICVAAFPFFGAPGVSSWPWIAATAVCNLLFLRAMTEAYACTLFSIAYAVTRAAVAPFVFLLGYIFLNEEGRPQIYAGLVVVLVSFLIFAGARDALRSVHLRGLFHCTLAGGLLACAIMLDIKGIREGGTGFDNLMRYGIASSLVTAMAIVATRLVSGQDSFSSLRSNFGLCYLGAVLLLGTYLSAMWAYSHGPAAWVASIREGGILLGAVLAIVVLRERLTGMQWIAMLLATTGVMLVQMG